MEHTGLPVEGIFIEPPEPGTLTDEDSADEDLGGTPDHLSRNQLLSSAEIRFATSVDTQEEPALPQKHSGQRTWIEGEFTTSLCDSFPKPNYSEIFNMTPVEVFELFMDKDIFKLLVEETKKYALFCNFPDPEITEEEIRCFIAILILSGYNELPGKRFFWDTREDTRNTLVLNSMRRNRFEQILRFIHCRDNYEIDQNDKLWKIRPLVSCVQNNCRKYFKPERELSYDECMIKYYGRHSCKQFLRGKPIRFGYKVWCLNTVQGYLVDFEVYQGKGIENSKEYESCFGKAAAPLVKMADRLEKLPYRFYFDNLFTSLHLLSYFRERGFGATGTIRQNRIPRDCTLLSKSSMMKKDRGYSETVISKEDGVFLVTWMDNSVVTVASNIHGGKPSHSVKRYSQKQKKVIMVSCPFVIGLYNKFMGGTDRMDEDIAKYRIRIRNKKWYWPIFSWLVDVCIHNAWILYKNSGHDMPQLEFRRRIVLKYLTAYGSKPKSPGRPRGFQTTTRVLDEIRYDRMDHLIKKTEDNKKKRCSGQGCKSIIRTMCTKCNVGLCVECFLPFHQM